MATSETIICSQALARIGEKRLVNLDTDDSVNSNHCLAHYAQTRDALLRSHSWRFASGRATLSQDDDDPAFEWDNQFDLPNDFLKMRSVYDGYSGKPGDESYYSYALEGDKLLTDQDAMTIRYVKKVTDPSKFDSLFIEVLALQLAIKLSLGIGQDQKLHRALLEELVPLMAIVRSLDKQETNTIKRDRKPTWIDHRLIGSRSGRPDLG